MLARLRTRLSYANVIATIALFVALGGGAYAATQLPKNSVGAKQLKKSSVNSAKVKDASLMSKDFRAGQLPAGARGPEGPRGPEGARGEAGQAGARGPSNAYNDLNPGQPTLSTSPKVIATVKVPAGNWVIFGRVNATSTGTAGGDADCGLRTNSTLIDEATFQLEANGGYDILPVSIQATLASASPITIELICEKQEVSQFNVAVSAGRLTAIQVETLTQQ